MSKTILKYSGFSILWAVVWAVVSVLPAPAMAQPARDGSPTERALSLLRSDPDAAQLKQAHELFGQACNQRDLRGCAWLGVTYRDGVGTGFDLKQAVALFRRACRGAEQLGCALWGDAMARGLGTRRQVKRGNAMMNKACEAGDGRGCALLGRSYLNSRGVVFDQAAAVSLFKKSCKIGDMRGCALMGVYENHTRDRSSDGFWLVKSRLKPAVAALRRACDSGDPRGCFSLGWLLEDEKEIRHPVMAYMLYLRACRTGALAGCYQAVMGHCDTRRGPFQFTTDHGAQTGRLASACRAGRPVACRFLARLTRKKACMKVDVARSRKLMQEACAAGFVLACFYHAEDIWQDKAVRDPDTTALFYKKACDAGYGPGCYKLAKMLSEGRYMAKSEKRAGKLHRRACELGVFFACGMVNR